MKAIDGPAAGLELSLRRAPMYLRLVQDMATLKWDGLDLPHDTPHPSDFVHVYRRRPGTHSVAWVCVRGPRSRDAGGRYESADYEYMPEVDGEALRETDAWRAWATAQPAVE